MGTEIFDLSASSLQTCKEVPVDMASTMIVSIWHPIEGERHPLSAVVQHELSIDALGRS